MAAAPQRSSERDKSRRGQPFYGGGLLPLERAYLDSCFGDCQFDLVARSSRDPSVVLIRWRTSHLGHSAGQPLSTAPTEAHYVLARVGAAEPQLRRIDDTTELAAHYPGHFPPSVRIHCPWTQRLWDRFQSPTRSMIIAAAAIWLALTLMVLRLGLG